jgi:UDP-glucose 4-epimerase
MRAIDHGEYFSIIPEIMGKDYRDYYFKGKKQARLPEEGYGSANTERLSKEGIKKLLVSLPEMQGELALLRK